MGFALETNNSEQNALIKLHAKNLDYIVLNEQQNGVSGFGARTNKITIFDKDEQRTDFTLQSKDSLAQAIIQFLETTL
jgi:phosphopantothenoylcysteine decarboxylase/phosphopantothenate--cysteine ligase